MFSWLFKKKTSLEAKKVVEWVLERAKYTFPERFSDRSQNEDIRLKRFEAISIFMAMALWLLKDKVIAQEAYDHMFSIFDATLREQGVGDFKVGKQVKQFIAAFNGRMESYGAAFDSHSPAQMASALVRNKVCLEEVSVPLSIKFIAESKSLLDRGDKFWITPEIEDDEILKEACA